MPIRYPGGTILRNALNTTSRNTMIASIVSSLESAGWGVASEDKAYVVLTFTGVPANNETCTFDGVTYRFVTTLAQAYDVLRGANAAACAQNLMHAILATPSEAGVRFHAATQAHPTLTASNPTSTTVRIQWNSTGNGNGFSASESLSNATLDSTVGRFGGSTLASYRSPHGLRMRLQARDNGSYVELIPGSQNQMAANGMLLSPLTGMYIIACRYQFCVYRAGGITAYSSAMAGIPFVRTANLGLSVSGAVDNNGRFEVSTPSPHNYATGQYITIAGAEGAANMNGTWQIEVTGQQTFILLGSTYSAGYVTGSARAAGPTQISDSVWASSDNGTTTGDRHFRFRSYINGPSYWYSVVNNMVAAPGALAAYVAALASIESFQWDILSWFDGSVDVLTPRVGWQLTVGGQHRWVGDMWAAFVALAPAALDAEIQFDGRTWINLSQDSQSSLWWAVS